MSVFCLAALAGFSLSLRINKFKITSGIKRQVFIFYSVAHFVIKIFRYFN